MYCDKYGLDEPTGNCTAGYYCNGGSSVPDQHQCAMARFCLQGTGVPVVGPNGTFPNTTKNTEKADSQPSTSKLFRQGKKTSGLREL